MRACVASREGKYCGTRESPCISARALPLALPSSAAPGMLTLLLFPGSQIPRRLEKRYARCPSLKPRPAAWSNFRPTVHVLRSGTVGLFPRILFRAGPGSYPDGLSQVICPRFRRVNPGDHLPSSHWRLLLTRVNTPAPQACPLPRAADFISSPPTHACGTCCSA